jgi:hypothetical protein
VIFTRATSILRDPATTRSAVAVASPARTKLDHLCDGEAVREHDRFGAAFGTRREQFERSPPVGLGKASGVATWAHSRGS